MLSPYQGSPKYSTRIIAMVIRFPREDIGPMPFKVAKLCWSYYEAYLKLVGVVSSITCPTAPSPMYIYRLMPRQQPWVSSYAAATVCQCLVEGNARSGSKYVVSS